VSCLLRLGRSERCEHGLLLPLRRRLLRSPGPCAAFHLDEWHGGACGRDATAALDVLGHEHLPCVGLQGSQSELHGAAASLRGVAACGAPCWSLRCTACLVSQSGLNVVTRRWQDAAHLLVEAQPPCAPLCRRRRWWRRIWHCCVGTPSYAPGTVLAKRLLGPLPRQAHVPRRSPPPGCLERRHGAIAVQKLLRRAVLAGRLRSVPCLDDGRHGTASPNDCSRARRSRLGCRGRSECWRVSRRVSRWQQQSAAARSLGTRRCGRLAYGSGLRTPRPRE